MLDNVFFKTHKRKKQELFKNGHIYFKQMSTPFSSFFVFSLRVKLDKCDI